MRMDSRTLCYYSKYFLTSLAGMIIGTGCPIAKVPHVQSIPSEANMGGTYFMGHPV